MVLSALRCVAETGALLGSLTLGLQFIVLGASLIPSKSLKGNSSAYFDYSDVFCRTGLKNGFFSRVSFWGC